MEAAKMEDTNNYLEVFSQFEKKATGSSLSWLRSKRQDAITRFSELGLPTVRDEDWRFTNIAPIARTAFQLSSNGQGSLSREEIGVFAPEGLAGIQLVFINGRYLQELSSLKSLPKGITVSSLAKGLSENRDLIESHLASYANFQEDAFLALNTAFMEDGAFVHIHNGTVVEEPIHLLYITTAGDAPTITNPRNLILAEDNSQASVVEHYVSVHEGVYFSNVVTEIMVGSNAALSHFMIERESKRAFNVSTLRVQQSRSSNLTSYSVLLGGAIVRNNIHPVLSGEGSECYINGLFMSKGRQHMDNYMKVEHVSPHCDSRQLYKGVLDGKSRGVFHGRIIVHKDAQKTDAKQTNRNLLLSDEAKIDTKPQLEIYADDVKCTHGATIGQLDESAIFYLRSRGLALDSARALLLFAFTSEILDGIKVQPIRKYVGSLVTDWFVQGKLFGKTT
jgi:Fe-S cluster assembly protein SufD